MPIVKKEPRYVCIGYELCCGFERATALVDDLLKHFKGDNRVHDAEDDTRGWDGGRMAFVKVYYNTLEDAIALDAEVRRLLGRNVNFTYEARGSTGYGSRGPYLIVDSTTTLKERIAA